MASDRKGDSTLSGSSSRQDISGISGDIVNPRLSMEEVERAGEFTSRGSGTDRNSDQDRLSDRENLLDKEVEDTFPASDPISSQSPMTGVGHAHGSSDLPDDFKDNPAAQFEYGRRTQEKTFHFETSTRRHQMGNPDIGEVDLGTIEDGKPSQPDDNDHFDTVDEDEGNRSL